MPAVVPYELIYKGKTIKTYWDRTETVSKLIRLSTELGVDCKITWEKHLEVEAQCMRDRVLITDDGETKEWKYYIGHKPLKGEALAKAIMQVLNEE